MSNDEVRKARVILDHIRASVFIVGDGVESSNKDRGYVLRRLLRRSMVYAKLLNLQPTWLKALVGTVITSYGESYQNLMTGSERIFKVIEVEQKKFEETLEKGLKEFERRTWGKRNDGMPDIELKLRKITGKNAFDLYQTYGFPIELTKELALDQGMGTVDDQSYVEEFKKHQALSRTASVGQFKGGLASHSEKVVRLHTATHLMNAALRKVLGEDVWQKGSNITEERTRFDFTYDKKMTSEQISEVEKLVNDWMARDLTVKKDILPLEQAKSLGAVGVFGEKYPETVSVYTVYDKDSGEIISREFCGGPHVEHTGVIGKFKIQKEEASSSGVRRIKATVE